MCGSPIDQTLPANHRADQVAMKACPYRAIFYAKLAADPAGGPPASQEKLNEELDKWLASLDAIVKRLDAFYEQGGHGKGF